jgi:hypothetical protein
MATFVRELRDNLDQGWNGRTVGASAPASCLSPQNALARALREIGCLERTLFILDWISDPALRRRSNAGLNKGEARNALARALFFHRHGEHRDRTFENHRSRTSGLNLTIAAITLWNTVLVCNTRSVRRLVELEWLRATWASKDLFHKRYGR